MIERNEPLVKTGAHLFTKWATYVKCPESTTLHFHSLFLFHYSEVCGAQLFFLILCIVLEKIQTIIKYLPETTATNSQFTY